MAARWFWLVDGDGTVGHPFIATRGYLAGYERSAFTSGQAIERWEGRAWLGAGRPEDDGAPDDVLQEHLGVPVFSARLQRALEGAGIEDIQYLPIRVLRSDGTPLAGFAIANVLSLVPALDLAHSDYDTFPQDYFLPERRGLVRGLRLPVLLRDRLTGRHIVRLTDYPVSLYASEHFKTAFEEGGFTWYSFHEVRLSHSS